MLVDIIAGARPNFMKISPIIRSIKEAQTKGKNINFRLIHTGQHYDKNMSDNFFEQLQIPSPHYNLNVGSGSQAQQTAGIMIKYEEILEKEKSDLCLVVGDVNSTMACSIVAKKMNIKVAHVEGGIRSGDSTMPEEINRMVTDSISDFFFTTSEIANENLKKEGIAKSKIYFVGNTMIDTLLANTTNFFPPQIFTTLPLHKKKYIVLTLHRPSNVDEESLFATLIQNLIKFSSQIPIVFPAHPRTKKIIEKLNFSFSNLFVIDPLSYFEFNFLVQNSMAVITDSGGVTEETTVLNVPCITLRNSTERPETCSIGTNVLVGLDTEKLKTAFENLHSGVWKAGSIPPLWDGKASERIVNHLIEIFNL
jgi:UDP-N-acetylglucosamine 2-epimerase (non-hydrolysing)